MGKIKLAVVGASSYADRLAEYMQKNDPGYLEVLRCACVEEMTEFAVKMQPDILLCEDEAAMHEKLPEHTVKILLSSAKNAQAENERVVFRYQNGPEIMRQVFHIYGSVSEKELVYWSKTEDLHMEAIYAPGGHELQLPFSLAYASICGETDKVLYINLAEFSGMDILMKNQDSENFSDLIYGIRQKKEKFLIFFQSVVHHTDTFDYIQPACNPADLYELTEEDFLNLLALLKEQTEYQCIIWNCGTFNPLFLQISAHCNQVFYVVKDTSFGKYRKMEFQEFLRKAQGKAFMEKARFVSPRIANGSFVYGANILTQLRNSEFTEQVKKLVGKG